jgi:glycosyltransferase involved in cell wall biosynthesis
LSKLLLSIEAQTYLNFEIIIIDQSKNAFDLEKNRINFERKICYVHDPNISGLIEAKKIGVDKSIGNYVAFLDDDSRPYDDYLERMCKVLDREPVMGLCGNVVNYPYKSKFVYYCYQLFNVGFFRGSRIGVYGSDGSSRKLICTHQLSGGCSIWRKEVFDAIPFDLENKFHYFEDVDFSYRAEKKFPNSLYINLDSKIVDLNEDAGVKDYRKLLENKLFESAKVYVKYGASGEIFLPHYFLYVLGRCFESILYCIQNKSLSPMLGFICGCFRGFVLILKKRSREFLKSNP